MPVHAQLQLQARVARVQAGGELERARAEGSVDSQRNAQGTGFLEDRCGRQEAARHGTAVAVDAVGPGVARIFPHLDAHGFEQRTGEAQQAGIGARRRGPAAVGERGIRGGERAGRHARCRGRGRGAGPQRECREAFRCNACGPQQGEGITDDRTPGQHLVGHLPAFGIGDPSLESPPVEPRLPPEVPVEWRIRGIECRHALVTVRREVRGHAEQRVVQHGLRGRPGGAELVARVGAGLGEARAAVDVVELVEQREPPRRFQPRRGILRRMPGERLRRRFGRQQRVLGFPHADLDVPHHAVAADRVHLQLADHFGQRRGVRLHRVEEGPGVGEREPRAREGFAVAADPGRLAPGRAAAVVADAVEAHHVIDPGHRARERGPHLLRQVVVGGAVGPGQPPREHAGARVAGRFPLEKCGGQRHLVRHRSHHDVAVVPRGAEESGQRGAVAEAVHVVSGGDLDSQLFPRVADPDLHVLPERRREGQVAVGLEVPAADDRPPAGGDVSADALEEAGVERLDALVEPRVPAGEHDIGFRIEQVAGRPAGRERLADAGRPPPEPDRVEVGIADHVHRDHGEPSIKEENGRCQPLRRAVRQSDRSALLAWSGRHRYNRWHEPARAREPPCRRAQRAHRDHRGLLPRRVLGTRPLPVRALGRNRARDPRGPRPALVCRRRRQRGREPRQSRGRCGPDLRRGGGRPVRP